MRQVKEKCSGYHRQNGSCSGHIPEVTVSTPPVSDVSTVLALVVNLFSLLLPLFPEDDSSRVIARQPLQIGTNVGGVLVAQLPVFLERLADDLFEPGGKVGIEAYGRDWLAVAMQDCHDAIRPKLSPRKGWTPVAIS